MVGSTPLRSSLAIPLAALLLTAMLAGCASTDDGLPWADYDEARAAPGPVFEAEDTDHPVKLKLLSPTNPAGIGEGSLEVVVLLFDSETDEPVTDASFLIEARMPAMGHGTSPETDPVHQRDGIYVGETTISMPGEWLINLDPQLADGTVLEYDIPVNAGNGSGGSE